MFQEYWLEAMAAKGRKPDIPDNQRIFCFFVVSKYQTGSYEQVPLVCAKIFFSVI